MVFKKKVNILFGHGCGFGVESFASKGFGEFIGLILPGCLFIDRLESICNLSSKGQIIFVIIVNVFMILFH